MRKLCDTVDRFCLNHPRFGIPNLMRYIVITTAVVFFLDMFSDGAATNMLYFSLGLIRQGELWRLLTWLIVPTGGTLWTVVTLLCYYSIGSAVEQYWGTAKFTLFYLTSAALPVVFSLLPLLLENLPMNEGSTIWLLTRMWIELPFVNSNLLHNVLFLAFATLFPTAMIRFQLVIPIQAKWLAILYVVITVYDLLRNGWFFALIDLPVLLGVWLAYAVFFWDRISDLLAEFGFNFRRANSAQTIRFKSAVRQQKKKEAERGYRHKCAVCGRTDADFPELEFRYCSRCAGYHCFCQDHIFDHVHFTE